MTSILTPLLFSTLFLAVGGGIVYLLLRLTGCQSSLIHRIAWGAVLLLGVLWIQIPLEIPVAWQVETIVEIVETNVVKTEEVATEEVVHPASNRVD